MLGGVAGGVHNRPYTQKEDVINTSTETDINESIPAVKATDILSVSPDASAGVQQAFTFDKKVNKPQVSDLVKRGIEARPSIYGR